MCTSQPPVGWSHGRLQPPKPHSFTSSLGIRERERQSRRSSRRSRYQLFVGDRSFLASFSRTKYLVTYKHAYVLPFPLYTRCVGRSFWRTRRARFHARWPAINGQSRVHEPCRPRPQRGCPASAGGGFQPRRVHTYRQSGEVGAIRGALLPKLPWGRTAWNAPLQRCVCRRQFRASVSRPG